ncbi:MAG: hypothetical protein A2784_02275 [Candidatus Chisholmbacteria bacterium RIFCSPHIGHO2_01_FULL_48_12]|uniref:AMP-dependent synthetase/ligase domain-containing protein n=1 Tax=Candidatus Chisholmbacteria bacterium RIFCSPHIGHO2_01_FULL_48_12 TaxID=1797589 RepID=A0A1G1VNA6_9BACT|nr:MAG: hypothetical protein A2784_02275 [Candidatus Chisholmbacteria bacterium RIFCSPHIGHO2_01_FULL_48_12]
MNLDQFLTDQAQKYASKPALIFAAPRPITISYSQLNDFTRILAHQLTSSPIAFALPNSPETILLNYAAWRAGLITVPLDTTRDTIRHKIYKLKFTDSRLLFTRPHPHNPKIKQALPYLKIIEVKDFSDFKQKFLIEDWNLKIHWKLKIENLDQDCLILFTSGTTALPKGVRLTPTNLFTNAQSVADWLKFTEQDRFFLILPLHHINSTTFANTTLLTGGTVIITPKYSKSNFWRLAARHHATVSSIVPTIAYDLVSETAAFQTYRPQLKFTRIQIGSAPVQPTVVQKFIDLYRIPLIQGYGQTETALRSTGVPIDLNPKQYAHIVKINSLGSELKHTQVSILNGNGQEANEGEVGDICVHGPCITPGYLNDPKANQAAFKFNWFHSGDTGYWQKLYGRKFFFMTGRTQEIIKKGGVLISPLAIENTLLQNYPDLDQVYAIGFPHPRLGQEIGIVAVTKHPRVVDQILADANSDHIRGLSAYESPQAAIVVSAVELPKTSTGKVQRVALRQLYGVKLLKQYRTISPGFRFIGPEETAILKQAVAINNLRWGKHLASTLEEFTSRAQNGLLIGAFDSNHKLLGTVSALRLLDQSDLDQKWTHTWAGITGSGTLSTHNHKGDSLVCVAISTQPIHKGDSLPKQVVTLKKLTPVTLKQYLNSDTDPIIKFHRTPKAGLAGAKIIKILPRSRPQDRDSLGYNVLMQYPTPTKLPTINPDATIGTKLIEAALLYAYQKKLKHIYVYTRPAALGRYFKS